jgi:hypothetical protein
MARSRRRQVEDRAAAAASTIRGVQFAHRGEPVERAVGVGDKPRRGFQPSTPFNE